MVWAARKFVGRNSRFEFQESLKIRYTRPLAKIVFLPRWIRFFRRFSRVEG